VAHAAIPEETTRPCARRATKDIRLPVGASKTAIRVPAGTKPVKREIALTDAEIDRLVYDLYGLTADEIVLVEGASA
jgi:hypothetical protein